MAKQADLLSVEDARQRILSQFSRLTEELVALRAARGRVLARPVAATMDLPPFANSSMDGFALQSGSTATATADQPVRLAVSDTVPAGTFSNRPIGPGESVRIMTGAPVPPGADAVVPFEDVDDAGDAIVLSSPVRVGACIRPAGQDTRSGSVILTAGTEIGAPQLALLAAQGMVRIPVIRQPRVAVLTTGDELVAPGNELHPGQIYNSNEPMLEAAILEAGATPLMGPTVADDLAAMAAAIDQVKGADLLLTSGGASVGDFDHVKDVVGGAGELAFWRVRVRPGKPLLFGTIGTMPVIGLPGNPTSAMVTFEQFVRPTIRTMLGLPPLRPEIEAVLDERIDNRGGRRTYVRVCLCREDGRFHATLAGPQDSAMLVPLARAHGLLEVPEDRDEMLPGEIGRVQVWRLPE